MKIALDPTPFHHDFELLEFPSVVADLGYEYLQPTSSSSQLESAVSLWDGGPTVAGVWECGPGEFTADRSRWCCRKDGAARGWFARPSARPTSSLVESA